VATFGCSEGWRVLPLRSSFDFGSSVYRVVGCRYDLPPKSRRLVLLTHTIVMRNPESTFAQSEDTGSLVMNPQLADSRSWLSRRTDDARGRASPDTVLAGLKEWSRGDIVQRQLVRNPKRRIEIAADLNLGRVVSKQI
jgi:hypothetical protein